MKATKTNQARKEVVDFLRQNYPAGSQFSLEDIQKKFSGSPSHSICITHLVALGYVNKKKRSVYFTTEHINDFAIVEKLNRYANDITKAKYHAKKEKEYVESKPQSTSTQSDSGFTSFLMPDHRTFTPITPIPQYTDNALIAELKSRGYKIMKPVNQFEEV